MAFHASCVAFDDQGILIRGRSGSGKSGLALQLLGMGANLVADDRTRIDLKDGRVQATSPASISGLIEARGIGLLQATPRAMAEIVLVIDMNCVETERLPPERHTEILGQNLPLLHKVESVYFAAAVRQYVIGGKADR